MIPEEKKKRVEALSIEEMLQEINLGTKSRFQREKFAYLQTCYQKRIEENDLIKKLNTLNLEDVKQNLRSLRYQNHEVPIVRKWIHEQEHNKLNEPVYSYHETHAPKGKIFKRHEIDALEKQGWVDTPAMFGKSIKSKVHRFFNNVWEFWLRRWPILLPIIVAAAVALFIHFDSKSTGESKQKETNGKSEIVHDKNPIE